MTTQTTTNATSSLTSAGASTIAALILGIGLLFVSGFAQADALHKPTHDTRHATGFPCH